MKTPATWQKASNERYARLGALVTRREVIHLELHNVEREIGDVQTEILAIERTGGMAAEVEEAVKSNGHAERATEPGA